jgi:hypothetical protein
LQHLGLGILGADDHRLLLERTRDDASDHRLPFAAREELTAYPREE